MTYASASWPAYERVLGLDHPAALTARNNLTRAHAAAGAVQQPGTATPSTAADFAKLVMAEEGARPGGGRAALEHELADCLWAVLNLAHRYGVGLDHAFRRARDDLKSSIRAQLPAG
ncbi:hypothetical protein [Streptomyces sp. NPDC055134]